MRRPWNLIDVPVYSLATYYNGKLNMNICTYVSCVSRKPKMYAISIEKHSKTSEYLKKSNYAVLQLMHTSQQNLVQLLGKKSGFHIDKEESLQNRNSLTLWNNYKVLNNVCALLELDKSLSNPSGDHELFMFNVKRTKTLNDKNILMFQDLISNKIIL
ncbi:MAG: hypothetical protein HKO56_09100 [Bacteroidia bacterium]|nr:flavin reductase family protein [Bacteroidia bacterium]NNC86041.1 hypothetical protein [Bacteroidia bacterium]NNM16802.1 hypothetical protein [Bacteroidia bacterium]